MRQVTLRRDSASPYEPLFRRPGCYSIHSHCEPTTPANLSRLEADCFSLPTALYGGRVVAITRYFLLFLAISA